jgi:chromosomal replication initiation ATPase DnaA
MTTSMTTPSDLLRPEDIYEGFNPEEGPDPSAYWDPETMEPNEEWDRRRRLWVQVKAYKNFHSAKYVPAPSTYEIPRPLRKWAEEIIFGDSTPELFKPLLVSGRVGVGKTWGVSAMVCYLAAFWERHDYVEAPPIAFHTASKLVGKLKNYGNGEARSELAFEVERAKVLVIDDLTRFKLTEHDMESLGQLLDDRQGHGVPTIFTLNHDPDEVEMANLMPPFLVSRLEAGKHIQMFGPDRRA